MRAPGGLRCYVIRTLEVGALSVLLAGSIALGRPSSAYAQEESSEAASEPAPDPGGQGAKVEQAIKQLEQLNYAAAQQVLFEVIQSGKATAEQMSQAYFNLGIVEAALDNEVEATDSFYLALMLKPSLLFPSGGSPKIRARLNEARSRVTEVGVLQVRAALNAGMLDVHVDNDPLKLVKRVEASMTRSGGEVGKATLENTAMRAEVDSDVQSIQVVLYDETGNQLKVIDVDPAASSLDKAVVMPAAAPSVWRSWGLWAGVAGALGLGGTYFMLESGSIGGDVDSAKQEIQPDEILISRLEDDQDRVGLYGVVGLSMAGAAAVAAGVLFFTGDDDKDEKVDGEAPEAEATLLPNVSPSHVGARFRLRF